MPPGIALREARRLVAELARRARFAARTPLGRRLVAVGSVRRGEPRAHDLDVLAILPGSARTGGGTGGAANTTGGRGGGGGSGGLLPVELGAARAGDRIRSLRASGGGRHVVLRLSLLPRGGGRGARIAVDVFRTTPRELPFALFHYTGPAAYNVRTRAHAKRLGFRLNQYGLFGRGTGRRARGSIGLRTEAQIARRLGLTARPPRDR